MSQPQLRDKFAVLYVLDNDPKSDRARAIANNLPEIYVQPVGLLAQNQIPPWLSEVPTIVTLTDRQRHVGTEALDLLTRLYNARLQQMQQMQQQQRQVGNAPQRQPAQPGGYPPQVPGYPPQQMQPGYPPQVPGYPPQQMQPGYPPQVPGYPPQAPMRPSVPNIARMIPQNPMQPMQQPPQIQGGNAEQFSNAEVVKSSIQPALGTGQYGCSLDAAFAPSDDPESAPQQQQQQPPGAPINHKAGKVDQSDIDRYLRLREQTAIIKPR